MSNSKSIAWGSNGYGIKSSPAGFNNISYLSIETWAIISDLSAARPLASIWTTAAAGRKFLLTVNTDGTLRMIYRTATENVILDTAASYITTSAAWQYIAVACTFGSSGGAKAYKGDANNLPAETTMNLTSGTRGVAQNGTGELVIGSRADLAGYLANSQDECALWDDIRTLQEFQDNYKLSRVGNESNLIAAYNFNDNALDLTSNDNDLTLTNSPSYSASIPFNDAVQQIVGPFPTHLRV